MSVSREALPSTADGAQAIRALLLLPVKAAQTALGRRLVAAAAVAIALQGMAGLMFANADDPAVVGAPAAVVREATAPQAATAPASAAAPQQAAPTAHAKPQDAAIAWFAKQARVPTGKVRALQQRPAGENKVKILVMADAGDRIDTDEVTVTRSKAGWRVR